MKGHKAIVLAAAFLLWAAAGFSPCPAQRPQGAPPLTERRSPKDIVDMVVILVKKGQIVPPALVRGRKDIFPIVLARLPELDARTAKLVVESSLAVGSTLPRRQVRWIFSQSVAGFLVQVLAKTKDRRLRSYAAKILVNHCPDACVRPWANEIVKVIKESPLFDNRILLLGKTGAWDAKKLLMSDKQFAEVDATKTNMALAKLGDTGLSAKFIKAFADTKSPKRKGELVAQLGYIGDAACVWALAREIRSALLYMTMGVTRRPLRAAVVEALGNVYPTNPILWVDMLNPVDSDARYQRVETWLTKYLGITWKQPRPKFVGSETIPTPAPDKKARPR